MGEAAVKEPSMEDILSSIRKIISEEGADAVPEMAKTDSQENVAVNGSAHSEAETSDADAALKMSDMLDKVRTAEPEALVENVTVDNTPSGEEAAAMAASLAKLNDADEQDEAQSTDDNASADVAEAKIETTAEAVEADTMIEPQAEAQSFGDIASSVSEEHATQDAETTMIESQEKVEEQVMAEPDMEDAVAVAEPEVRHVEMAEAMPAPEPVVEAETPAEISPSTVETMVQEEVAFKGALMSPTANGEVSGAFDRLKRSAMDDIDAKTEAILRPMLREWLDDNLPNMVERLVREEIERVARG